MSAKRVAIITGAGKGIGKSIALTLANVGIDLMLCDIDCTSVESVSTEAIAHGVQAITKTCDVSIPSQVEEVVMDTLHHFEQVDILVNNAGVHLRAPIIDLSLADWEHTMQVNLRGTFLFMKAVLPHMIQRKTGKIINISSDSGKMGWATGGAYCASKFGVLGLTQAAAHEVARHNINVNAVCPGAVETPMSKNVRQPNGQPYDMRGWMQPPDIAEVVLFLTTDAARGIHGAAIDVFGKTHYATEMTDEVER